MGTIEAPTVSRRASSFALLVCLLGCEGSIPDAREFPSVEILPSGATRVTSALPGIWPEGGGWRLVIEAVIGRVDGDGPDVFSQITGVAVGEDGTAYVLDRQSGELRSFSPFGVHLRTVGRTGEGPGEYNRPAGLLWASNDTLVVVDQGGQRYSLLHGMEHVRSVPRRMGGSVSSSFRGGIHEGRIYEFTGDVPIPGRVRTLIGSQFRPPDPTAVRDSVVLPLVGPQVQMLTAERDGRVVASAFIPFAPRMVYYLDRSGSIWYGHSGEFRILQSTWGGEPVREIVLDAPGIPILPEEMNARVAPLEDGPFGRAGGRIDRASLPATKPHFDALYLDPDGNLWVSVPAPGDSIRFAIFQVDGRFLGYLAIDDFRPQGLVEPVVQGDRLYIVSRDELEVDQLHIYRIER